MRETIFKCDICGAVKLETEINWYLVGYSDTHAHTVSIKMWKTPAALRKGTHHICGVTCLSAFILRAFETQKVQHPRRIQYVAQPDVWEGE